MANTAGQLTTTSFMPLSAMAACFGIDGAYQDGITLDGAFTFTRAYPSIVKMDPGGAHRDCTLDAEAESKGLMRFIVNGADAAENLVVKDDSPATIATINQNEAGLFHCNGTAWKLVAIWTIALS